MAQEELDPQQRRAAEERAPRWEGQKLRLSNQKSECEMNIPKVQNDLNRSTAALDALVREKEAKVEQLLKKTVEGAASAETGWGALGLGLLGGAGTAAVSDAYDKEIRKRESVVLKLRRDLREWQEALGRVRQRELEMVEWPRFRGHSFPVITALDDGLGKDLGLRKGDLYISYDGQSLAYVSSRNLNTARSEAQLKGGTVEVVFARDGKLLKFRVPAGKPFGMNVDVPIWDLQ